MNPSERDRCDLEKAEGFVMRHRCSLGFAQVAQANLWSRSPRLPNSPPR
jgi:hypothetical protein